MILYILLPTVMLIAGPVERRPNRLTDEKPHGVDAIGLIHSEPVVNSLRQRHQIPRLDPNAHPLILLIAYVEISRSTQDVTNLFSIVDVLLEECLYLRFVFGEFVRFDGDDVGVGVAAIVAKLG